MEKLQDGVVTPSWFTVKVRPAALIVPLREVLLVFAPTE
jgi:hypothetical protein